MPLPNATNNPTTQLDTYLSQEGHYQRKFVIRTGGKSRIAAEDEVLYFFSEHHATTIVLEKMAFDYDLPLNTLEIRLDPSKFLRLHRNSIVRIDQIASFTHDREAEITLKNGTRLQASRGASQELKKRLRPD
jgi:two-component system LytT family response regulator